MARSCKTLISIVLVAFCINVVAAHKILFLAPIMTKSHIGFFGEITTILADRGHEITLITSYDAPSHPNVTQTNLHFPLDSIFLNPFKNRGSQAWMNVVEKLPALCAKALQTEVVRELDVEIYDLIIFTAFCSECFYSLIENTTVPVISAAPNTIVTGLHDQVGNVDFPSFVNMLGMRGAFPLTFKQRAISTLGNIASNAFNLYKYYPRMELECKKIGVCREDMKPIREILTKPCLLFINSVRSLEVPARPYVPAVIHAGGLNCRPAKPLPQELVSWVEDAGDAGFIYLSLGTAVKASEMPEEARRILVSVLGSLPQRVLWKWDQETMEDLPTNIKLSKWLPQQDILGHSQLKLFISHGGLFSTLESTYHGVPILGMPVFIDQHTNIDRVVSEGWGERIDWHDFSEDEFKNKINLLINNKSYKEVVQHRSVLMRDQPMSPQDTVVYWTEYVIRHKGAAHLRSPILDMSWREVYNMDVWASLLALIGVVLALLAWMIRAIVRRCCRTKRKLE